MRLLPSALVVAVVSTLLLGPTAPPASAGALTLSANASRFDAYTGFTRENFEGSEVPDGDSAYCGVSLSAFTTSACYATGVLQTGFVLEIAEAGSDGIVTGGPGYHGMSSSTVLANNYNETLVVRFTDPTDTVGFRISSEVAGQCSITVRYADASPATTRSVPCPAGPASRWVGIEADRRIGSVRVTGDTFTHLDDLTFGVRPPNRIRVGSAVAAPALGTARLRVTVPGIGVTTVRGPGIVGASLDSARRRVHRFEIRARGTAAQTLRRTGRVTVRVTVTYRPNRGIARSVVKRVTLVRRR